MIKLSKSQYTIIIVFLFFMWLVLYKFFLVKEPVIVSNVSQDNIAEIQQSPEWVFWFTNNQIISLYKIYQRDWDEKIAKSLLQYYISIGDYSGWYELLEEINKKWHLESIYEPTIWFVIFNYAIANGIRWSEIDYEKWNIDWDVKTFHDTLTLLIKNDYTWFNTSLIELSNTNVLYKNIISILLSSKKNFSALKDPPPYYQAGLYAATLMEAWYMPLAWLIASDIIRTDKKYILSYEILSQIAIKQKKYDDAIKYLKILFSLDSQHIARTAFFLGKSYFWKWDYSNALVYLNQVADEQYMTDAIRYMILTYHAQNNIDKMMNGFRYLLTEKKLTPGDYLLLYDIVFFEPYTKKLVNNNIIAEYELKIIIPYIDSCRKNIAKSAPYVCKYGEAWRYLSQNKPEKALMDLLYLTKTYPHPTVYKALWDYYTLQWDNEKAQWYFVKSLITSADTYENTPIYSWNSTTK